MSIQEVVVARVNRAVEEMVSVLGPRQLSQIASEPTDHSALLRAMEESLPKLQTPDPLAEDRLEALKALKHLLEDGGPMLSAVDAGSVLSISRQAIHNKRLKGDLLAIKQGRSYLYPAWQFQGGSVLEGLAEVLAALKDESSWAILRFFVSNNPFLQNETPKARLEAGDLEAVLKAATAHGSQGAS